MPQTDRSRLRRDELKSIMLDAGRALLHEDGLGAKTAPVGYADAFRWLKDNRGVSVSRAQVHRRIWDSVQEYRQDVMLSIADYSGSDSYTALLDVFADRIGDARSGMMTASTDDERKAQLVYFTRKLVDANAEMMGSLPWAPAWRAVYVMHSLGASVNEEDSAITTQLRLSNAEVIERFLGLYRTIADELDVTPHLAGLTTDESFTAYAQLINALSHGAASRSGFENAMQSFTLGGEPWTVEAITAAAVTGYVTTTGSRTQQDEECVAVPRLVTNGNNDTSNDEIRKVGSSGRMKRETLRTLMIEAGAGVLVDRGFGHGAEQVTYGRVFERVRAESGLSLVRAQVHGRIWESQDDFQLDLLAHVVRHRRSLLSELDRSRVVGSLSTHGTASERAQSLAETCRLGSHLAIDHALNSTDWMLSRSVGAFHAINRDRSDVVGDALDEVSQAEMAAWGSLLEDSLRALRYTPKPWTELTLEETTAVIAAAAAGMTEGVVARSRIQGHATQHRLQFGGGDADWNLLGIGIWCLINFLLHPDEDLRAQ